MNVSQRERLCGTLTLKHGVREQAVRRAVRTLLGVGGQQNDDWLSVTDNQAAIAIEIAFADPTEAPQVLTQWAVALATVVLPEQWLIREDLQTCDPDRRFSELYIGADPFERHLARRRRAAELVRRVMGDDAPEQVLSTLQRLIKEAPVRDRLALDLPELADRDYLDEACDEVVAMTVTGERIVGTMEARIGTGKIERWARSTGTLQLKFDPGDPVDADNSDFATATNVFGEALYLTLEGRTVAESGVVLVAQSRLEEFLDDVQQGLITQRGSSRRQTENAD